MDMPNQAQPGVDEQAARRPVARAKAEGVDLGGPGGLSAGLIRQVAQAGLEVEKAEHLKRVPALTRRVGLLSRLSGRCARPVAPCWPARERRDSQ